MLLDKRALVGEYNICRTVALLCVLMHSVTGFVFTINFLQGDYTIQNSILLFFSCLGTAVSLSISFIRKGVPGVSHAYAEFKN